MDEYIYKDEAFAIIENKQREICPMGRYSRAAVYGSDREAFDNWQEILDEIEAIPSADVAPVVHGRWERVCTLRDETVYRCSECNREVRVPLGRSKEGWAPYCHCGAKMDGELNE